MGLFDKFIEAASSIVPGGPELVGGGQELLDDVTPLVDEVLPEFDPTSDGAEYGDEVRFAGDVILNVVTEGGAGTAFSDSSEGIEELNDATGNAFTAENIGDAISGSF